MHRARHHHPGAAQADRDLSGGDTARAADIFGFFGTAWALMQFVFSPMLGALSDRFGRRPVILISRLGLGLDYLLMALAPSLGWLFVGRVISGITRGQLLRPPSPISPTSRRPKNAPPRFGMLGAAFGIGFVLGPALGGLLGRVRPAPAVLGRGGPEPGQCGLRLFRPARVAAARAAHGRSPGGAPTRSARCSCCARSRRCSALAASHFLCHARARRAADASPCSTRTIATAGTSARVGLALAAVGVAPACRAGRPGPPGGGAVRRARGADRRPALRRGRLCHLRPRRRPAPCFWLGVPVMALWGLAGAALAGPDEPAWSARPSKASCRAPTAA